MLKIEGRENVVWKKCWYLWFDLSEISKLGFMTKIIICLIKFLTNKIILDWTVAARWRILNSQRIFSFFLKISNGALRLLAKKVTNERKCIFFYSIIYGYEKTFTDYKFVEIFNISQAYCIERLILLILNEPRLRLSTVWGQLSTI